MIYVIKTFVQNGTEKQRSQKKNHILKQKMKCLQHITKCNEFGIVQYLHFLAVELFTYFSAVAI